jgi:hypothetical protein
MAAVPVLAETPVGAERLRHLTGGGAPAAAG